MDSENDSCNEEMPITNDPLEGEIEEMPINNNILEGDNEEMPINNDILEGDNEEMVINNDILEGDNEEMVINNEIFEGDNEEIAEEEIDENDEDHLLLLNRSEEKLSETQTKFAEKARILDKRSTILNKKSKSKKKSFTSDSKFPFIKTFLERKDLPNKVFEVLQKERDELGTIENMESNELISFWTEIRGYVNLLTTSLENEKLDKNKVAENVEALNDVLSLILYCKEHINSISNNLPLFYIITFLNGLLFSDIDFEIRLKICEVCELCCIACASFTPRFYLDTINFLVQSTLQTKDVSKAVITRLWLMYKPMRMINLKSNACKGLVKCLIEIPKCPAFLSCREGRNFISFLFARLDQNLIKDLHQSVRDFLPKAKRSQANFYGEVYFSAWATASPEYRKVIESQCIQDLMTYVFILPRTNQEMNRLGQNVFEILKHLHDSRKHVHFSKIITELYTPLIWRYLRSGNNIERCNATEVFLHAYPLEKPGQGMETEMEFQERQQNEMVDLLTDNCHVVRIIAIKGICAKLESCWNTFPAETVQVLVRTMVQDLANDGSSADVRKSVFKGLAVMLQNKSTIPFLSRVLPQINENVHDVNEKVRRAFIEMLLKLKQLDHPDFTFNSVVSVKHLLARLQYENVEVGEPIVNLLMDLIVSEDREQTLMYICKMIVVNPLAARKFFKYSKKSLIFEDAVNIMKNILAAMRNHVKNKEKDLMQNGEQEQLDEKNEPVQPQKKKRTSKRSSLSIINHNIPEEKSIPVSSKKENPNSPNNPIVSYAMIDIVSILWCLHSKQLLEPGNEQKLNDLHDLSGAAIPLFLRFYKTYDKNTYFAVIHLASLVPLSKLTPTSTIGSACMSQLKSMSEDTPEHELAIYVLAICAWNRAGDIIELVINCLDQAFRSENLNQSAVPPEGYKSRTVKFQHAEVKPLLALKLLDIMFSKEINQKRIMVKSYDHLYELLIYLSRIKVIAENRVNLGIPLENVMLSDELILQCLYRYYKMLIILDNNIPPDHPPAKTFNAAVEIIGVMEWARRIVFPMVPNNTVEVPGICERILQDILRASRHIIATNTGVDNSFLKNIAEFMKDLLSFGCSLWFVEGSLNVILFMIKYADAYHDKIDETTILKTTVPVILSHVFLSLSQSKYSQQVITTCIKNINEAKFVMAEVPHSLLRRYGNRCPDLQNVLKMFVTTCVAVISFEIKELQVLDTVDKLTELPYVSSMLLNALMARPVVKNHWLSVLTKEITTTFSEDPYMLLSSISLLHTLSFLGAKLSNELLSDAVRAAFTAADEFKPKELDKLETSHPDSITESSICSLNVKQISLPVLSAIASRLQCGFN